MSSLSRLATGESRPGRRGRAPGLAGNPWDVSRYPPWAGRLFGRT